MVSHYSSLLVRRFADFTKVPRRGDPEAEVRLAVLEVLERVLSHNWRSYVVGGTLRDILVAPGWTCPRDIDLVVDGPSPQELEKAFADLLVRRTRFGGLRLSKKVARDDIGSKQPEVLLDIWRLQDTWGIRSLQLTPTIENFVRTPFLNIDSVAIELHTVTGQRRVVECGFFDSLETRTLDINYGPNPFPLVCIVRALIIAAKMRFALAPSLARFVLGYSQWGSVEDMVVAQSSHYGTTICQEDELRQWLREIKSKVETGIGRIEIDITESRLADLWRDRIAPVELERAAAEAAMVS